ncbi:hypothetical protein JCM10207_006993 [Rhodosporidiobolus poonsookiae]
MFPFLQSLNPFWVPSSPFPSSPSSSIDDPDDPPLPLSTSLLPYLPRALHPLLRSLIVRALRLGPRPAHIAFIMDGNRRSARERRLPVQVGHEEGFDALKRVLSFLLKLDIPHVTVYAFSIENFNRPPAEVDALMGLARTRLVEICQHGALLQQYGVRIRVLGRRDLLPPDVQASCAEAEALTALNTKGILNLCCPYASQEEIATAIKRTVDACVAGSLDPASITPATLEANLYTSASPPLDILIRSSGVNRLSDFLLWQASDQTTLHFVTPNWPDIGVAEILPPLLAFQAEKIVAWVSEGVGRWTEGVRWALGWAPEGEGKRIEV